MKQLSTLQLFVYLLVVTFLGLMSCTDESAPDTPNTTYNYPGMYICNEGPFQSGTGTVDFYRYSDHKLFSDIYGDVNGIPLGNVVQSMLKVGDTMYIVVNNSNKIIVVNAWDFKKIGSIEGLTLPRFMRNVSGNKAYVSCWDNTVAIINLKTLQVSGHIPVGNGPEKMLVAGSKLLVLNQGGFSVDSTISIINTQTDMVVQTLGVYPRPSGIIAEKISGDIWVICSGKGFDGWPGADDSEGHLLKLNDGADISIEKDIEFPDNSNHPSSLVENPWKHELYYLYKKGICRHVVTSSVLDTNSFVSKGLPFYALGFADNGTAAGSSIVVSDPIDFNQQGWVYFFRSTDGHCTDSIKSGVIPTDFLFVP